MDGTYWGVTLQGEGKRVSSSGDNAYPGQDEHAGDEGPTFSAFCRAVSRLVGGRDFA